MQRRAITIVLALLAASCASSKYAANHPPSEPFDVVVVPGCPSEEDGSPSQCQIGRAGQAALLWRDGWTRNFIVSGSDVHTPYVEAEALAQAMTVLGVPPTRIVLERDALHTDENVYYSMLLARRSGFSRVAVTSYGSAASWMCDVMRQWGQACWSIGMNSTALAQALPPYDATLHTLRARRVEGWEPLGPRADRIARVNGYSRPPSWVLYPLYGWLGPSHRPMAPEHPDPITWEQRLGELQR